MKTHNSSLSRIAAIEKQASISPNWFRFKVGIFAVTAEAIFQLTLIAPWVFLLGFGALWYRHTWFIGLAIVAVLVIWWALQPSMHIEGQSISRDNSPQLYALLDEIVANTDALTIHEIRIDDSFNAGALELGHGWIPGKVRRILILGGPLIATLSTQSLKAVIAHEMGHFSRKHGRLGHWIYRARLGWSNAASYNDENDSLIDKGVSQLGRLFLHWFNDYAFVHSRLCEYEADAIASQVVGAHDFIAALAELNVAGKGFHSDALSGHTALNVQDIDIPTNLWLLKAKHVKSAPLPYKSFEDSWNEPAALNDTHPTISQRGAALGCGMETVWLALSNGLFTQAGDCDSQGYVSAAKEYAAKQSIQWRLDHARLTTQNQLNWQPSNLSIDHQTYFDALELIRDGNPKAVTILQELRESNPSWVAATRGALTTMPQQWLEAEERERNIRLLQQAYERRSNARYLWLQSFFENTEKLEAIDPNVLQVLKACISAHPHIEAAAGNHSIASTEDGKRNYPIVFFWIRVDPKKILENLSNDETIAQQIANQIQEIAGADVIAAVVPTYTTEPEPRWVSKLSRTNP
jgi:Zn-dependent protease with chaperone function